MVTQRIANPCRKTMQVRVLSLTPNTGLRKVWLIRLLWEQEIVGSNPTAPTNNTPLAQWLEQNAHNVLVTGSSPVGSTKCGRSIMVLLQISNLKIGVRFPSSAPNFKEGKEG